MGHENLMGGNRAEDVIINGMKLLKMSFVPADNAPLNKDMPTYIEMNPAGAVDVLMPAVTADMAGLMFFLSNISSNTITLKTSGDAAFTTAIVLAAGENCWVVCTGSSTAALGWRGTATASSA
jgi:hypothetical protein